MVEAEVQRPRQMKDEKDGRHREVRCLPKCLNVSMKMSANVLELLTVLVSVVTASTVREPLSLSKIRRHIW
jgi:hypothetical protein